MTGKKSMETGPIRPPSEAKSLLIRATRNCPWNKCAFCHTYCGRKFEFRPVDEIRQDILTARAIADRIEKLCREGETSGQITQAIVDMICAEGEFDGSGIRAVASWLYYGGESVFLQDANTLVMKTADLCEVLSFIREKFPSVRHITSYCRSRTAARKSVAELKSLADAGLTRIHIGLESGFDPLLEFMRKGATAADHMEGGIRIKAAGISLCEYVMPGLGGHRWTIEHAEKTAEVLNVINPHHIRLRSLHVVKGSPLFDMMRDGLFEPLGDEETVKEISRFIGRLNGITSRMMSDHIMNLLEELEGRFPEDKERLLQIIDRFFALSPIERLVFRVGRRKGIYRKLDDLSDSGTFLWLKSIVDSYLATDAEQLDRDLKEIMDSFI
ncbi:MAG: coproporphyrinogen oxidase [Geobacteraceae bacterium]|nr:coproporphyrinogen oxidase [Geobacteraceae bacterium]